MTEEDIFIDPENVDEIIERVKKCPTMKDINDLLYEIYPKWIVLYLEKYSEDYPQLQSNWEFITSKHNIKKCQMVIVEKIVNDDKHTLIKLFSEIYSLSGFIIRTKDEIIPCEKCFSAIPNIKTYEKMKDLGMPVPERWLRVCQKCLPILIKEYDEKEISNTEAKE
jgi:hypothetical protein